MKRYSLTLTGETLSSVQRHDAVAALAELLRLTLPQADAVLGGKPRPLKGLLSYDRAVEAKRRFEQAGIGCELREEAPRPAGPRSAAAAFKSPPKLDVEPVTVRCPKCDFEQPPGDRCTRCGVVYAKLERLPSRTMHARTEAVGLDSQHAFPYRLVNQLVLLVFLSSLGLAIWSQWKKDQLPPPGFYDLSQLQAPRQQPTDAAPFKVEAEDITYTIEPLFDYELDGVVVSLHDSDVFWDIYHFKDWKDFINIRDLCVVWGDNVATGVFRDMHYKNSTWTCWISTTDPVAHTAFVWDQLSNNHLLSHEESIQKAIKSAEIGDQIRFRGKLAKYSHAGGFHRGTSTSRTDRGNGACETVYIEDFRITRKSNTGWRLTYRLSSALAAVSFIGLAVLFVVAPYRPHR
jgi:hypothetical protein